MALKWLESMSNELKELGILDILVSDSTKSGPGLERMSPDRRSYIDVKRKKLEKMSTLIQLS